MLRRSSLLQITPPRSRYGFFAFALLLILPSWGSALGPVRGVTHLPGVRVATAVSSPSAAPLIWSDEFTGTAGTPPTTTRWGYDLGGGGWGNNELETYTSRVQNAALDGAGHMSISVRKENYTGSDGIGRSYTSARLSTRSTFSFLYGTVEARIKVPAGDGLWPAFWLLGSNIVSVGWPWCGEIDAMETVNSATIMGVNAHGPNPVGHFAWQQQTLGRGTFAAGYHTYSVHWTSTALTYSIDGVFFGSIARASLPAGDQWVFDKPMYLLLNVAVGGTGPGMGPDASTVLPASMLVDWVHVYGP